MHAYEREWRRLPLEGTTNTRELGGYPTAGGGQTAWHRFLRSDTLDVLTDADVAFLRGYGVRLVLDLRGSDEAAEQPDRNLGPDVLHRHVTLVDFDASDIEDLRQRLMDGQQADPRDMYLIILANKGGIAAAMRALLEAPAGSCALFHCQAGKDRTGTLAMLLLALAGVDRQDCINDYAATRENLLRQAWYREQLANAGAFRDTVDSLPQTMADTYDWLCESYGGAEGYLRVCGLAEDEIAELRRRLLAE